MSAWLHPLVAIGVFGVLSGNAWRTLASGEVTGWFVGFRRARQPIRYWAYLMTVIAIALGQLWLAFHLVHKINVSD